MPESRTLESVYRQATHDAMVVQHPTPGLIWAEGRDRLDLLNRMSTNQLDSLPKGQQRPTVLTNPVGQTIDTLQVLALEDRLVLVTSPGKLQTVQTWLNGYIFFQDDVKLTPFDEGWTHWGVYGPKALRAAAELLGDDAPLSEEEVRTLVGGLAWRADSRWNLGVELLLDTEGTARAQSAWSDRETDSLEEQVYEVLRVEFGVPQVGREVLDDTIPLEAGLWDAVSFSKGCYIGQEIIARLESRGRLAKQLTGVRLGSEAAAPTDLLQSGRRIGTLTSVAQSPNLGWIGLALVKPSALESDGGLVTVDGDSASGRLVPLPFSADAA
jgi:folate-binding protein YgfZ